MEGHILREVVHHDELLWLLDNIDTIVPEERVKFRDYAMLMLEGEGMSSRLVTYHQLNGHGRLYAEGARSLQSFSRHIRVRLAKGLYHDLDMQNAHPVILLDICTKHGIKCPRLNYYVKHRQDVLSMLAAASVPDAKRLMLSIMYGGGVPKKLTVPQYVRLYAQELANIANTLFPLFPDLVTHNAKRPTFSRMSLLLQDTENTILQAMCAFFKREGYEIGCLMFDGMLLHRKEPGLERLDSALLRKCEAELQTLCSGMSLVEKDIA
jgi:hypothetical protein